MRCRYISRWLLYFSHLDVQLGLLQLEVALLTPRLLGLLDGSHGVHLDVAVIDDLVAVFVPANANLQRLS